MNYLYFAESLLFPYSVLAPCAANFRKRAKLQSFFDST